MSARCIVWDIGNTTVKEGLFEYGKLTHFSRLEAPLTSTEVERTLTDNEDLLAIVMASGKLEESLAVIKHSRLLVMNSKTSIPLTTDYATPETLGLDRKANAVAVAKNPNSLVIDLGTCITYDWVLNGKYMGGAISPGWKMRLSAMHNQTAALPFLEAKYLDKNVGKTTDESMLLGAQLGIIGEINSFVERYTDEASEELRVYLTGGDASHFEGALKCPIFADPYLTLKGLHEILLHNLA